MSTLLLHEDFDKPAMDARLAWLHPPGKWSIDASRCVLIVEPDARTDFWQKTHYGFDADNGHFLFAAVQGDVILTTRVSFRPAHQYDQAGLMARISPSCWLKTSVEFEPEGPGRLGVVVTNAGYSDWSTQQFPRGRNEVWLRIRREGTDALVEFSEEGDRWAQIRMAHLHEADAGDAIAYGLYAASPTGAGFVAEFGFVRIELGRVQDG
jgi:regulation of enolase protein 1 (concanavalin A-like superfamily)